MTKRIYPSYNSWAYLKGVGHGSRAFPPIPAAEALRERQEAAYWAARDVETT